MTSPSVLVSHAVENTASTHYNRPTFLMCAPQWYGVDYVINPWMAGNVHGSSRDAAFGQWKALHHELLKIADVKLLHPRQGSSDMAFVAHTALVHSGLATVSRFAHKERQSEEAPVRRWLTEAGFLLWETPRETAFEGEGDAIFDADGRHLWAAHGLRTCQYSHQHIADAWHVPVSSLHLVDPRFYHLDTCFAPLAGGYLLYYPGAFDAGSLEAIEARYAADKRIAVSEAEATRFACNVLNVGRHVIMHPAGAGLRSRLQAAGFEVTETPMHEFLKSGASVKCLALRLSDCAVTHGLSLER